MNSAVTEDAYQFNFHKTLYFKNISRFEWIEVDLLDAIDDLLILAPRNTKTFMRFYNEHEGDPYDVVTKIWSYKF